MNHSKAGKKLSPELKAACDAIFKRDHVRYRGLVKWVWFEQCNKWPDEAIVRCLNLAEPYIDHIDDYWPYLARLLPKCKAAAVADESEQYKSEVGKLAGEFVEFLKQRQKAL